jgi:hypothetical protein
MVYGFDIKCPQKGSYTEDLLSCWWCYGKGTDVINRLIPLWMAIGRLGVVEGAGHWECAFEGSIFLFPLSAFWLPKGEIFCCHDLCLEGVDPADRGLKPLKPWGKINLFSFKLLFLGILSQ